MPIPKIVPGVTNGTDSAQSINDVIDLAEETANLSDISADADNRLTRGGDSKLMVPELAMDPLAYYILAKS